MEPGEGIRNRAYSHPRGLRFTLSWYKHLRGLGWIRESSSFVSFPPQLLSTCASASSVFGAAACACKPADAYAQCARRAM